ncbi:MAG: hypothetical protein COB20_07850 [SAR86 cluster bacterium]|uniref:Tubulin--tyrosine ligase n=1 Tax=SAR86 cluster bacterium TaxID=2030880 RepID=A0A2A4X6F0_9GAMM|nr:MAG: hypothetical protein COB20_07850 [SAR86 cluster bacterium]
MTEIVESSLPSFVFHSNRGTQVFRAALEPLGGREYRSADRHIDLLYFDQYQGKRPPQDVSVGFTLIKRQQTIPIDNKLQMANALIDAGINYPRVYFIEEDVPDEPDTLWYIKDPVGTAGKGICVVPREGIARNFEFGDIIQEAIQDLLLQDGKKFTLRVYVLVHEANVYLFQDGIVVLHGAVYDPQSVDPKVQYEHTGYMDRKTDIELSPFSDAPFYGEAMTNIRVSIASIFQSFKELLKHEEGNAYCLFGIDMLVRENMSSILIEINDRPNLIHTNIVNTRVNIPAIQAMYCVLNPDCCDHLPSGAKEFELIATL